MLGLVSERHRIERVLTPFLSSDIAVVLQKVYRNENRSLVGLVIRGQYRDGPGIA